MKLWILVGESDRLDSRNEGNVDQREILEKLLPVRESFVRKRKR